MYLTLGEYRGKRTIKAFMRYALARFEERRNEQAYRIFVTECLRLIPQQKYLSVSFEDVLNAPAPDTRSGDEIAADIINRLTEMYS